MDEAPSSFHPLVPREVDAVLAKLLARSRDHRDHDARAVVEDLAMLRGLT